MLRKAQRCRSISRTEKADSSSRRLQVMDISSSRSLDNPLLASVSRESRYLVEKCMYLGVKGGFVAFGLF
jgi:hypothetical protein